MPVPPKTPANVRYTMECVVLAAKPLAYVHTYATVTLGLNMHEMGGSCPFEAGRSGEQVREVLGYGTSVLWSTRQYRVMRTVGFCFCFCFFGGGIRWG